MNHSFIFIKKSSSKWEGNTFLFRFKDTFMSFVETAAERGIIPQAHSSVAHSHLVGFKNMGMAAFSTMAIIYYVI